jgi:Mce-associated membrane protein
MAARSTNETPASDTDPAVLAAEADAAEADAAEAEAMAAATAARAKAARLRKQAEESRAALVEREAAERAAAAAAETTDTVVDTDDSDAPDAASEKAASEEVVTEDDPEAPVDFPAARTRTWVPGWKPVAVGVAVIALVAFLVLSGLMIWSHRNAVQREDRANAFATGARQGVVNLMSLNFNNGQADLQRVLDSTTGPFHDDFQKSQQDFLTVMKDSKVVTSTAVTATAIESMTDDSAVVLLTATSQVANNASQQPSPRNWRLSVTVVKENDQIKMSKVEFVP